MPQIPEFDRELRQLEADLRQLEVEYNMYFAGRLARPPWETRTRVNDHMRRMDRSRLNNFAERFRFTTLQNRFAVFVDLWDRALRAREEGRPGPFVPKPVEVPDARQAESMKILHVVTFQDPRQEADKLRELYDRVAEARQQTGETPVAYQKFEQLITIQVAELQHRGSPEVAFRVAIREGRVSFTARGVKGVPWED